MPHNFESVTTSLREQMPVTQKWAYFDHAAVAPLPRPTQHAIRTWLDQAVAEGDVAWNDWVAGVEQTRATAAEMIGAASDEIALVPNTTSGITLVAEGLPWQAGDNVVTAANEFPTNLYPWLNLESRQVTTRRVPVENGCLDLNRLADACDARTRIITVSWVGYATGFRIDPAELAALAHARGALLFLDAIQGLGVFPLDVQRAGVDFLAADGHKWMLGPEGAGLFYCRREHLGRLRPIGVGWNSVQQGHDFDRIELRYRETAARFEGGSQNMAGLLGLGASLRLLRQCGAGPERSAVGDAVLAIAEHARKRLAAIGAVCTPLPPACRSGIVSFEIPGQAASAVRRRCLQAHVALSCRSGRLRISPHAYNNEGDVERLIDVIEATATREGESDDRQSH